MDVYIAADIGGTQIRVAVFPPSGITPLAQKRIPTRGDKPALERLMDLIVELWLSEYRVLAIGAAAPGPTDSETGVVYIAPNIPGWVDLPLAQNLKDRFRVPVVVGNDANMAGLAEWRFGAAKGHHHVVYMTISTGIGGGVIIGDKLLTGNKGLAGELGHVTVVPDGLVCTCGQRGHLESYSSGISIAAYVKERLTQGAVSSLAASQSITAVGVSRAAAEGDALALEAMNRAGRYLGIMIGNYLNIFNPSIIVLGGGVSRAGGLLFDPLRAGISESVFNQAYLKDLIITHAALGDDAGLMGSLALAYGVGEKTC